jgi:hypothetical protein
VWGTTADKNATVLARAHVRPQLKFIVLSSLSFDACTTKWWTVKSRCSFHDIENVVSK